MWCDRWKWWFVHYSILRISVFVSTVSSRKTEVLSVSCFGIIIKIFACLNIEKKPTEANCQTFLPWQSQVTRSKMCRPVNIPNQRPGLFTLPNLLNYLGRSVKAWPLTSHKAGKLVTSCWPFAAGFKNIW